MITTTTSPKPHRAPYGEVFRQFQYPTVPLKTRSEAAEREFLRYKKVTADGRVAINDPSDLFDLMHLDQRADRVPPNGWCLLPPRQVCAKGNACLTCDKFVTDASHRGELERQLEDTENLISRRQTQFTARHGEPMGADNIWLAGRTAETTALRKVLISLDELAMHSDGKTRAVRGAGTPGRRETTKETTVNRLPEHLRRVAGARTASAERKARRALQRLITAQEPISFAAVARAGDVSTDFLYRHVELRTQIERQRAEPRRHSSLDAASDDEVGSSSTSAAVRALARKLDDERRARRQEVAELRKALETAQGENLALRRRLDRYEPA
ncbi:hypothetical protein [Streptosporangium sp. NPDC000396]|uniref:hypothetical protein n=1 Tax=Streptosporangium sp. NPDC000396 TaxID=3366185 RepID=UPI0036A9C1EB